MRPLCPFPDRQRQHHFVLLRRPTWLGSRPRRVGRIRDAQSLPLQSHGHDRSFDLLGHLLVGHGSQEDYLSIRPLSQCQPSCSTDPGSSPSPALVSPLALLAATRGPKWLQPRGRPQRESTSDSPLCWSGSRPASFKITRQPLNKTTSSKWPPRIRGRQHGPVPLRPADRNLPQSRRESGNAARECQSRMRRNAPEHAKIVNITGKRERLLSCLPNVSPRRFD